MTMLPKLDRVGGKERGHEHLCTLDRGRLVGRFDLGSKQALGVATRIIYTFALSAYAHAQKSSFSI